jgi:long-chain acyl-CoA synthetase
MVGRVIDLLEANGLPPVSGVRTLGLGGSPVAEQLRERAAKWFPNVARGLAVTYGLSEACGVVATGAGAEVRERRGTVGRPLVTCEIRIDEPDDAGVGEIMVRSPGVMLGYWRPRGDTGDDFRLDPGPVTIDRWLHTGDIGRLDTDGYLYVTDRSKDIVIRGGENIATPHVEDRLARHPSVREVAVIGLPHATLGEELGAVIVLRAGESTTAQELAAFCSESLAYFEVPSRWRFDPGPLPQNTTGKILKREVRRQWIEELATARKQ